MKDLETRINNLKQSLDSQTISFERVYEGILLKNNNKKPSYCFLPFIIAFSSIAVLITISLISINTFIIKNDNNFDPSIEEQIIHGEFTKRLQYYQTIEKYESYEEMELSMNTLYGNDDFYNICYFKPTDNFEYSKREYSLLATNQNYQNDDVIIHESFEIKIKNDYLSINCFFTPVIKNNNKNVRLVVDEKGNDFNALIFSTSLVANIEYDMKVGANWLISYVNNELITN